MQIPEIFSVHCITLSLANFPQRDLNKTCQNLFCFLTYPFKQLSFTCMLVHLTASNDFSAWPQLGKTKKLIQSVLSVIRCSHFLLELRFENWLFAEQMQEEPSAIQRLLQHSHRSCTRHYRGPCNQLHFSQNCCISRNDNDPATLNQHITAEKLFRIRQRSFVFQDRTFVFIRLRTIAKLEEINFPHITLCRKLSIGC